MKNYTLAAALVTMCKIANTRSAWSRGVRDFAEDLLAKLDNNISDGWYSEDILEDWTKTEQAMLNGAKDWKHYAWSGCGLCYNADIAKALCNKTELKKTHNGALKPNKEEDWPDVYGRAMYQAAALAQRCITIAMKEVC